jgi:hypothetical protein
MSTTNRNGKLYLPWFILWVRMDIQGLWHITPMVCVNAPYFYVSFAWLCFTMQVKPLYKERNHDYSE